MGNLVSCWPSSVFFFFFFFPHSFVLFIVAFYTVIKPTYWPSKSWQCLLEILSMLSQIQVCFICPTLLHELQEAVDLGKPFI